MSHRAKSITQAVKRSIGEPPLSTSSPSTPHRSVEKNICERSGTSGVKGRPLGLTVSRRDGNHERSGCSGGTQRKDNIEKDGF